MADQDFNIKVVTTADTSGIDKTDAAIKRLDTSAKTLLARQESLLKSGPFGTGPLPTQAPAGGGDSGGGLTEGTIAGRIGGMVEHQFTRMAAHLAGIAIIYKFLENIKESAAELEKVTAELQKEGQLITDNALKFSEIAKFATDQADVIKIGESALKGVESAQKQVLDLADTSLNVWQKIADVWTAGFKDKGPIQQAKELHLEQATQNYEMAKTVAIHEIIAAKRTSDDLAAKSYTDKIVYLTEKIKEQEDVQRRVGVANVVDYLKAGSAAENYRKILEKVSAAERQRQAAALKASEATVAKGVGQSPEDFQKTQDKAADEHHAKRMSQMQQLKEAEATGNTEHAKQLKDELTKDTFNRDQRKEALQRYSALQEDLMEREGGGPESLGKYGEARYKAAQSELADIYKQERGELHPEEAASQRENQKKLDADLDRQRAIPLGLGKTPEQILKEQSEREIKSPDSQSGQPPGAKPSALPSPDVVQAIKNLEMKFERLWS